MEDPAEIKCFNKPTSFGKIAEEIGFKSITTRIWLNIKHYFGKRTRKYCIYEGFLALLHILDTFGDLIYFCSAPFYSWVLFSFLVVFWITPIIILLGCAFLLPKRHYTRVERFYLWLGMNLDILHWFDEEEKDDGKVITYAILVKVVFVCVENFPSATLQTLNNLMIGYTLTNFQIVKPLIGFFCGIKAQNDLWSDLTLNEMIEKSTKIPEKYKSSLYHQLCYILATLPFIILAIFTTTVLTA